MILRDVGAVQLDLPVEDTDIYPDIKKGKTRKPKTPPQIKEGGVCSLLTLQPLNNARLKDVEEEKFVSTPEYEAEMSRDEHIIEKIRQER